MLRDTVRLRRPKLKGQQKSAWGRSEEPCLTYVPGPFQALKGLEAGVGRSHEYPWGRWTTGATFALSRNRKGGWGDHYHESVLLWITEQSGV